MPFPQLSARVFDAGEIEGRFFITSELVDAGNLRTLLEKEAPLPPDQVLPLAQELLRALAFLHVQNIVHGRLHSRNILVEKRPDRQVWKNLPR